MIIIESINHIFLTVSDLEQSIKFYRDLFDFDVIEKLGSAGQAFLKMGDILLGLIEVPGYKNSEKSQNRISFFVDEEDFEDAVDELEDLEMKIVYGPENIRNGQCIIFLDPDGNQIELSYPRLA